MNKNKIVIFCIALLILVLGGIFFLSDRKKDGENWDSAEYVFDIEIPDDFDENKVQRVNMKINEAKALFEKRNDDEWFWIKLGNLYEFVHDYDRAVYVYEEALEMSPYSLTSVLNLALLYEKQFEDFDLAEYYYKKAIEINSSSPGLYDKLAKFYYRKMKDFSLAEKTYLDGLKKFGEDASLLSNLIIFYEQAGKQSEQAFYAKRLLELYPDNGSHKNNFEYLIK